MASTTKKRRAAQHPVMSWEEFYDCMRSRLVAHSFTQRIIGMSQDDVKQELLVVLWRAWFTWDPDGPTTLEQRFWAMWLHRKASLIRKQLAAKRADEWMLTPLDIATLEPLVTWEEYHVPPCPDDDVLSRNVWTMLSFGMTRKDVIDILGISKSAYHRLIASWRTDTVRALLATG